MIEMTEIIDGSAREEAGSTQVQERKAQSEHARAGQGRSEDRARLPLPRAEPRDALQQRDDAHRQEEPRHGAQHSRRGWVFAALGGLGLLLATAAHAMEGTAPEATSAGGLTVPLAALLGAVQGATEFLPVSSSGHLALAQRLFGIDAEAAGHRFSIAVHAGTLLAVLWIYRQDLATIAAAALRPHRASEGRAWVIAIGIATIPLLAAILPWVEPFVLAVESHPRWVGLALWATALVLWLGFRGTPAELAAREPRPPTPSQALGVGLAQLVAILPGVSRSGSTIAAGMLLGIDRERAARFSFLISIPAITGAVVLELRKLSATPAGTLDPLPYAVGFATALVVGFVCLRWLLALVRRGRILGFVAYLVVVGGLAIALGS